MEKEEIDFGSKSGEPVTFGSTISFKVLNKDNYFLASEGYMISEIFLTLYDRSIGLISRDFSFCQFKIIPFSSASNYSSAVTISKDLAQKNFMMELDIKKRREKIIDLKQNLETEVAANINIYNKLKGTPVLFQTSVFQLVHVASMKFLALNKEDENNLFFELVDFPNVDCFFKFMPCLKLQTLRNNVVYDKDVVFIVSTSYVCGRNPCIYTADFESKDFESKRNSTEFLDMKISGNIEKSTQWRIHMYSSHEVEEEAQNRFLTKGDIIWINLADYKFSLEGIKEMDPFEKLFSQLELNNEVLTPVRLKKFQEKGFGNAPTLNKENLEDSLNNSNEAILNENNKIQSPNTFRGTPSGYNRKINTPTPFKKQGSSRGGHFNFSKDFKTFQGLNNALEIDNHLNEEMVLLFSKTDRNDDGHSNVFYKSNWLWKIEGIDTFYGGLLKWDVPYRIRHFSTGRYMKAQMIDDELQLVLSKEIDEKCLFKFVNFDSRSIQSDMNKIFIAKDSFYRIQHCHSKCWVGYSNEIKDGNDILGGTRLIEAESLSPVLNKEYFTEHSFKMVRASFQDRWETSFLLNVRPILREGIETFFSNKEKNKKHVSKERKDTLFKLIINTLELMCDFVMNRVLSNITINQDYSHTSSIRQKILRELFILGKVCWFVYKVFPTPEELELMDTAQLEGFDWSRGTNTIVSDFHIEKKNSTSSKLLRNQRNEIKRRYLMCQKAYEVIEKTCKNNEKNQEYVFNFFHAFMQHLGHGKFLSKSLARCLEGNQKLLLMLNRYSTHMILLNKQPIHKKRLSDMSINAEETIFENEHIFLSDILVKMKLFPSYTKFDLLDLLSDLCICENKGLYLNQIKVFETLNKDKYLNETRIIGIINEDHSLKLQLKKNITDELINISLEDFMSKYDKASNEMKFFLSQLNLYSSLCIDRNFECCSHFSKIFRLDTLIKYILNNEIDATIRSLLCKLLLNIYLDKDPRVVPVKPNLVRVMDSVTNPLISRGSKKSTKIFSNLITMKSREQPKLTPKKSTEMAYLKPDEMHVSHLSPVVFSAGKFPPEDLDLKKNNKKSGLSEVVLEEEIILLQSLKKDLLDYLGKKYTMLIQSPAKVSQVFNELTLQVITIVKYMMEFGIMDLAEKTVVTQGAGLQRTLSIRDQAQNSEIQRLVKNLVYFLEFDETYNSALSFFEIRKKTDEGARAFSNRLQLMRTGLNDLATRSFKNIKNLFVEQEKNNTHTSKTNKTPISFELESEAVSEPLFKKIQSLKKVLMKFSNKTVTIKSDNNDGCEVSIKKAICSILHFLMDQYEDFLIENTISYFKNNFVPDVCDIDDYQYLQNRNEDKFLSFFPDKALKVGQAIVKDEIKFKLYTGAIKAPVKFFDETLEKSVLESILQAFYFAENSELQNNLMKLVHRCCNQKLTLWNNIEKLELLLSEQDINISRKIDRISSKLQNLFSRSQVWLHINNIIHNKKNEKLLDKALSNISKLDELFKKDIENINQLRIKQCLLKNKGILPNLIQLTKIGKNVIDSYSYLNEEISEIGSNKSLWLIFQKILKIESTCFSIFSLFCLQSPENQQILYNLLERHIEELLQAKIDIGLMKTFDSIFEENFHLSLIINDNSLDLIVDHILAYGKFPEFLKIFEVLIENSEAQPENLEIPKKVLRVLLRENKMDELRPVEKLNLRSITVHKNSYFKEPPNEKEYRELFIQIISRALKSDIGINMISKAYKMLDVKILLNFLLEKTKESEDEAFEKLERRSSLTFKRAVCDILTVYFTRSDTIVQDLLKESYVFGQIISLETRKINKFPMFSDESKHYVYEKLVPLVNTYSQNFLIDTKILMSFMNSEETQSTEILLEEFAKAFIKGIDKFLNSNELSFFNTTIKGIIKLAYHFKLDISVIPHKEELEKQENRRYSTTFESLDDLKSEFVDLNFEESKDVSMRSIVVPKGNKVTKTKIFQGSIFMKNLQSKNLSKIFKVDNEIISENEENLGPKKLREYWELFKDLLRKSKKMRKLIKEEKSVLSESLLEISNIYLQPEIEENRDLLINSDDMLIKFFNYVEFWRQKNVDKHIVIFCLQMLGRILKITNKSKLTELQNRFDKINATKIFLVLFWEEKESDRKYLYSLVKFAILLLQGGNKEVQKSMHDFFISNSSSEKFFKRINSILNDCIVMNQKGKFYDMSLLNKILRLLHLICEGHNHDLQNYLRYQSNSKHSYDLVTLTSKVLLSMKLSNVNFTTIIQAFDCLTEFSQGPCKENQKCILNSKFLEYVVSILNEDKKILDEKSHQEGLSTNFLTIVQSAIFNSKKSIGDRSTEQKKTFLDKFRFPPKKSQSMTDKVKNTSDWKRSLHRGRLSRIRHRCLTTIISLLECNNETSTIYQRVKRIIPVSILKNDIVRSYKLFKKYFNKNYSEQCFKRYEIDIDENRDPEEYEFIIESGFLEYILLNRLLLENSNQDIEEYDDDLKEMIQEFSDYEKSQLRFLKVNFIIKFFRDIRESYREFRASKRKIDYTTKILQEKKKEIKDALLFFSQNTAHIEIVRENELTRVYFPKLPMANSLPTKLKKEFHENVDRSNLKTKLKDLMYWSDRFLKVMNHEELLKQFFQKYPLIGYVASKGSFWENAAFYTSLIIHFMIIVSYSGYYAPLEAREDSKQRNFYRLRYPRFLYVPQYDITEKVILSIGILNLLCSSVVVFLFALKRAPLLVAPAWNNFIRSFRKQLYLMVRIRKLVGFIFVALYNCLTDYDFVYYVFYIFFAVSGITVHPFLFVFHLTDFLRIQHLKNVVKAIWIPKISLFLTIVFFVLIEYFFSIAGYYFFAKDYEGYCDNMWKCFLTTFDQTFKNSGGIGSWLSGPYAYQIGKDDIGSLHSPFKHFIERFFFDNISYILLVLIIVNMLAGIIIDTFGMLKDALQEKSDDETQNCFICGISREKLDKSSDGKHGFITHIKMDHYMWNYIYFKAYLEFKENTEFDGNESFIYNKIKKFDLSWFPIKRALSVKDEEDEQNEKLNLLEAVSMNFIMMNGKLESFSERMIKLNKTQKIID